MPKIGFRKTLILAFALLTAGYASLGVLPTTLALLIYGKVVQRIDRR